MPAGACGAACGLAVSAPRQEAGQRVRAVGLARVTVSLSLSRRVVLGGRMLGKRPTMRDGPFRSLKYLLCLQEA